MSDEVKVPTLDDLHIAQAGVADAFYSSPTSEAMKKLDELVAMVLPLVEEADCKRRVVEAGWDWKELRIHGISIHDNSSGWLMMKSWPAAAEYAEAHAIRRCSACGAVIPGE